MSSADWEKIEANLNRIGQMAELITKIGALMKLVIGMGVAVVMSIAAVAVWVKTTTTGLAATQAGLLALEAKRDASMVEWTGWRRTKDDTDIRLTVAAENLQKLLERQQAQIDRFDRR